ncbi:MAG: class I SAM-dependent methyltransferase [Kouleothrix sp.]|nr:class I SAM-dependent methyltransferase [Kouleothrix sp.]
MSNHNGTEEADKAYPPEYFAAQIRKSDAKIAWQYSRIFGLAGVRDVAGLRVVDVGCGAGPGLRYLATRGATALGLDHSRYALETALQLSPGAGVALNDSTRGLPCGSQSADLVLLSELVEHVVDAGPLFEECYRVLKVGGRIVVTTPNLWDVRRALSPLAGRPWSGDTDPTHVNLYTPARLARELRRAGFTQVRWSTGVKPARWLSSRRLRLRLSIPYPPLIGNGLLATGRREH